MLLSFFSGHICILLGQNIVSIWASMPKDAAHLNDTRTNNEKHEVRINTWKSHGVRGLQRQGHRVVHSHGHSELSS